MDFGRSLPSLDNFVILSRLLHTNEDILVVDGMLFVYGELFMTIENLTADFLWY